MSPTPFVYFAYPIDFSSHDFAMTAYAMQNHGLAAYMPGHAFKVPLGSAPNEVLNRINRAALTECDALVAVLPPPGEVSFGVPMEIEQARAEGKPTLIVGDSEIWTRSWALPKTDLVIYTDEVGEGSVRSLRELIAREKRRRSQRPPVQSVYVRLDPGSAIPTRAYEGDAGFDLYTAEETEIPPGEFVDVPVGCSVQFPDRVWGLITGRSSTVRKLDLLVTTAVIDTGYRGPLFAGVRSLREDTYIVKKGERLAQLIPFNNVAMGLVPTPVDVLTPSDRGEAGFGSSGA